MDCGNWRGFRIGIARWSRRWRRWRPGLRRARRFELKRQLQTLARLSNLGVAAIGEEDPLFQLCFRHERDEPLPVALGLTRWRVRVKRALNGQTDLPHA